AQLGVEVDDVPIAHEEVVVVALEQVARAHVERRRLAAEARPALVDVAPVPALRQPVRGHESRDARPDDGDVHPPRPLALGRRDALAVVVPRRWAPEVPRRSDQVEGAALHLVVDAPYVLADDPDGD